jgi:two-component system, OmpR family, alkaline phosphatase synthesis response regulator PhoP
MAVPFAFPGQVLSPMSPSHQPRRRPHLLFDPEALQVSIDGVPVSLTKTEFRVLQFLVGQKGSACSRRQIIDAVQGENYPVTERSVDVQIVSIRKKLGAAGKLVQTVRGEGFRFQEPEDH